MALKDWKLVKNYQAKNVWKTGYSFVWKNKNKRDGVFVSKRSLGYIWGLVGLHTGTEFVMGFGKTKAQVLKFAKAYMRKH